MIKSKLAIPYLHDHHNHFTLYAGMYGSLCLKEVRDKDNALELLKKLPDNGLNTAYAWNSGFYTFTKSELNSLPPVLIVNLSLHGFILNDAAKRILEPQYPEIICNFENSEWREAHVNELLLFFVKIMPHSIESMCAFAEDLRTKFSIYEIEDMLLPSAEMFEMIQNSPLRERVTFWADYETFKTLPDGIRRQLHGVKLFADGANGSKTSAISEPFLDGSTGILNYTEDRLFEIFEECAAISNGIAVHTLGDLASKQVVDVTERLRRHNSDIPVRIEHAQFIDEQTARRAKDLGIVLSMQPNFSEDSVIYRDRLSERFLRANNPFRMLIDDVGFKPGTDLLFGSDGMPHGIRFALSQALFPPYIGQKLTISELVAGYAAEADCGLFEIDADEVLK